MSAPTPMTADDVPAVLALLAACGLPVEDVREVPGSTQLVLREDGVVIATVGVDLEPGAARTGADAAPCALGDRVAGFRQFTAACCAGAACYVKHLGKEPS